MSWFESVSPKRSGVEPAKPFNPSQAALAQVGALSPLWLMFIGASTAGIAVWSMTRWMRLAAPEPVADTVVKLRLVKPVPQPAVEPEAAVAVEPVEVPIVVPAPEPAPEPVALAPAPEPVALAPAPEPVALAPAPEPVAALEPTILADLKTAVVTAGTNLLAGGTVGATTADVLTQLSADGAAVLASVKSSVVEAVVGLAQPVPATPAV